MTSKNDHLHVYPDAAGVAQALAELFVGIGQTAFADRGRFNVALAGGNTPRAAYQLLAQKPYRSSLSWSDVFIYFGDERCVPPTDAQSNYYMAKESFLDAVGIPATNVQRMAGELDPAVAATEYAKVLAEDLGNPPRFDLVMLGLGADGHTASLFPGSDPMTESDKLVRGVYSTAAEMWRITLTPDVINAARNVIVSIEGYAKFDIFEKVRDGSHDPTKYPIQIVAPTGGRLIWLADEAAAGTHARDRIQRH